ncbi:MAG TPA: hypothetical protein VM759_05035 [Longimicrobium sp.]|nr:hypothetical protein [Longimicrobium sp.]
MRAKLSIEALDVTSFSITPEPVPVVGGPDSGDEVQITPTIPIITATIIITATDP